MNSITRIPSINTLSALIKLSNEVKDDRPFYISDLACGQDIQGGSVKALAEIGFLIQTGRYREEDVPLRWTLTVLTNEWRINPEFQTVYSTLGLKSLIYRYTAICEEVKAVLG